MSEKFEFGDIVQLKAHPMPSFEGQTRDFDTLHDHEILHDYEMKVVSHYEGFYDGEMIREAICEWEDSTGRLRTVVYAPTDLVLVRRRT